MARKKKEKIIYVDDGRTIADMSGVRGGFSPPRQRAARPRSSLKEQWNTYWAAVKLMLRPTLVAVVGILLIFAVAYLVFLFA